MGGVLTFAKAQQEAWECAEVKGFHKDLSTDCYPTREALLARLCLIHTEISEAAQEVKRHWEPHRRWYAEGRAEHMVTELADAIIRILDVAALMDFNMEEVIAQKMRSNRYRPYKYGTPDEGGMDG